MRYFCFIFIAVFIYPFDVIACTRDLSNDSGALPVFNNIQELTKCSKYPLNGQHVFVSGYRNINDGGGGVFVYDEMSVKPQNGGTVLKADSSSSKGRWIRVFSGERNVLWFGATGNAVDDDTLPIQRAIDDTPEGGKLIFPMGKYVVSGVTVSKPIFLEGLAVSKWHGRGAELVAKGDQKYVLGFIYNSRSINGVRLGGEVSHLSLNGNGKRISDAIFVGIGFSEVTIKSLEIGNGIGDGVLLRQWYEGRFDDVFINRVDASESNAVFYIGSVMLGKRPANVNNLRIYNSRFEANFGIYFKTAVDANLDIFSLSNSKFECCYERQGEVIYSIFDFTDAFRVQIINNSFTHFSYKRGYSPLFKFGIRSSSDSRGVSARVSMNDFIFLDSKTTLTDFSGNGAVFWSENSASASIIPQYPFVGVAPVSKGDALINYPRP